MLGNSAVRCIVAMLLIDMTKCLPRRSTMIDYNSSIVWSHDTKWDVFEENYIQYIFWLRNRTKRVIKTSMNVFFFCYFSLSFTIYVWHSQYCLLSFSDSNNSEGFSWLTTISSIRGMSSYHWCASDQRVNKKSAALVHVYVLVCVCLRVYISFGLCPTVHMHVMSNSAL